MLTFILGGLAGAAAVIGTYALVWVLVWVLRALESGNSWPLRILGVVTGFIVGGLLAVTRIWT